MGFCLHSCKHILCWHLLKNDRLTRCQQLGRVCLLVWTGAKKGCAVLSCCRVWMEDLGEMAGCTADLHPRASHMVVFQLSNPQLSV